MLTAGSLLLPSWRGGGGEGGRERGREGAWEPGSLSYWLPWTPGPNPSHHVEADLPPLAPPSVTAVSPCDTVSSLSHPASPRHCRQLLSPLRVVWGPDLWCPRRGLPYSTPGLREEGQCGDRTLQEWFRGPAPRSGPLTAPPSSPLPCQLSHLLEPLGTTQLSSLRTGTSNAGWRGRKDPLGGRGTSLSRCSCWGGLGRTLEPRESSEAGPLQRVSSPYHSCGFLGAPAPPLPPSRRGPGLTCPPASSSWWAAPVVGAG